MSIMESYNLFFYKIYKFWDNISEPKFWSDAKATFTIIVLEIFLINSFEMYYKVLVAPQTQILSNAYFDIVIDGLLLCFNVYYFIITDRWKIIVSKYDKKLKGRDQKGNIIATIIILMIIAVFVTACWVKP